MDSLRTSRISKEALRLISNYIVTKSKDDFLKQMIIQDVEITNDLSYMFIYYRLYDKSNIKTFEEKIKDKKYIIKDLIAKNLKIRKIPDVIFKYDKSLDEGNKIDELLKEIEIK